MANNFRVNQLQLTNNIVVTSGNNLVVNGNPALTLSIWNNLTWNNPLIWNATTGVAEDRQRLILTGNSALNISGLYNGWAGALEVIQSGNSTTGYNLTLPAGTRVINGSGGLLGLTMTSGARDIVGFEYNGITLYCAIGNNFN